MVAAGLCKRAGLVMTRQSALTTEQLVLSIAGAPRRLACHFTLQFYGEDCLNRTAMKIIIKNWEIVMGSLFPADPVLLHWTDFVAHPSQTPGATKDRTLTT